MIKKKSWMIKSVILSVAIALISVFFFAYAIQSVYPAPEYNNYCEGMPNINLNENGDRIEIYNEQEDSKRGNLSVCNKEYNEAKDIYERNVFFANSIIAISIFVLGFFLAIDAVSSGLMGGGVILIFYGTLRYWGNLSDIWRTSILGISLIILIWLGYKKLND